jgi:hypothetical protein
MTMQELAKRIKRDSRSLKVQVNADSVTVTPVFQHPLEVRTWEEYREAAKTGRIAFPDSECGFGEGS